MSYRVFSLAGHGYQFDNDTDAARFAALNPDAVELTPAEIEVAFGYDVRHVGPHNTMADEEGAITFNYAPDEAALGAALRAERDRRIQAVAWRVERNLSETRQGLDTTDDITVLDGYVQDLRDMPTLDGWPWNGPSDTAVPWPNEPE